MRRALPALVAAAAALLSACGGSGQAATTTSVPAFVAATSTTSAATSSSTTTTTAATTTTAGPTTTTLPPGPPSPLNGLPVADETLLNRRIIAVKVDNHPMARPQSGLQEADAVIEILVEGGITRFIALFHQSDSEYVGPVRSVRPTDSTMLAPLDAPLVFSGGQEWIQQLAYSRGVALIAEGASGLFRMPHRSAPHNLYANTVEIRQTADDRGLDDDINGPLYAIGPWQQDPAETATQIDLSWGLGHYTSWSYHDGLYWRTDDGLTHRWITRDGETGQLAFELLVVIEGRQYWAQPPPDGRSAVPAIDTVGTGTLLIFYHGKVLRGTWQRDALDQPFRLFDTAGNPVTVPPAVPWISVYPQQQPLTWE